MSNSNQEIIEARLATYIDGELDAQERLEIEAHLQQNPQYRKLVEELRHGRDMLRGLPREPAPAELSETFTSQLERSVLLSSEPDQPEPRMRVGAWPRMFATAAILFLTFGLATIVYFVLPARSPRLVASSPVPRTPSTAPSGALENEESDAPEDPRKNLKSAGEAEKTTLTRDEVRRLDALGRGSAPDGQAGQNGGGQNGVASNIAAPGLGGGSPTLTSLRSKLADQELDQLAADVARDPHVQELFARPGDADAHLKDQAEKRKASPIVMVVRAGDPRRAARELNEFLVDNGIDGEPAPPTVELALNTSIAQQREQAERNAGSDREAASKPAGQEQQSQLEQKKKQADLADGAPAPTPQLKPSAKAENPVPSQPAMAGSVKPQSPPGGALGKGAPAPASASAAAPAALAAPPASPSPNPDLPANSPKDATSEGLAEKRAFATQERASIDNVYVVRRLTRAQAQELNDCLARSGEVRLAGVDYRSRGLAHPQPTFGGAPKLSSATSQKSDLSAVDNSIADHDKKSAALPIAPGQGQSQGQDKPALRKDKVGGEGSEPAGPSTQPSATIVQKGDHLQFLFEAGKDGKQLSETVEVREDGTIELNQLEAAKGKPIPVAGKSLGDVEKEVQSASADGAAPAPIAGTGVKVVRVTEALKKEDEKLAAKPAETAATAPSVNRLVEQIREAQRRRASANAAPATSPAPEAESAIDVVIVLQKDPSPRKEAVIEPATISSPAPAAAPATQPSSTPPAPEPER